MSQSRSVAKENPYPRLAASKPPLLKRVLARLRGRVRYYVDTVHFEQPTWIYLCYCREHKVYFEDYLHTVRFEDYPHIHSEYVVCPECWWEEHWMDAEEDPFEEEQEEEALEAELGEELEEDEYI